MRILFASMTILLSTGVAATAAGDSLQRPDRSSLKLGSGATLAKPSPLAEELADAFAQVVDHAEPVVVSVYTSRTIQVQRQSASPFPFLFGAPDDPDGDSPDPRGGAQRKQEGGGSGFVVDARGYVMTNAHVVKDQDEIKVELYDRTRFEAKVVGIDEKSDVAVLKIDPGPTKLRVAAFGNSDKLRIGQWVLALGNPYMFKNTVTAGIVSAKGRNETGGDGYTDYIQTDAAVNPGNSGGPLVNLKGEVVGINSSIWTRSGGYQGISFAIPINMARRIAEDLICEGVVTRGWLGVVIEDLDPELADALKIPGRNGAKVAQVAGGAPAEKAGVKSGDIVLKIGGEPITGSADLRNRIAAERPGAKVVLTVLRDGRESDLVVVLGRLGGEESKASVLEAGDGTVSLPGFGLKLGALTDSDKSRHGIPVGAKGVLVVSVEAGSPAKEKGLKEGMAILEIIDADRKSVQAVTPGQVGRILSKIPKGSTVALKVAAGEQVRLIGLRSR